MTCSAQRPGELPAAA